MDHAHATPHLRPAPTGPTKPLLIGGALVTVFGLLSFANVEYDLGLPEMPLLVLRWVAILALMLNTGHPAVNDVLVGIAVVLTLASAVQYFYAARGHLAGAGGDPT
jgi:phosphatidylglycerophosphate synthase